jgi:hypothetical protein
MPSGRRMQGPIDGGPVVMSTSFTEPAPTGLQGPSLSPATTARAAIRVPWLLGAALVAALLLVCAPYRGVRHDAELYLGQALVRIDPSWWRHDLYFEFGSQDRYSLFSRLFVWPVAAFGIPVAEMAALTIGRLATFFALYLLVDWMPPLRRWLALAVIAGTTHYYGGKTFAVLEPFVTARTFAEPLSLLAIGAVLKGRKAWGLVALVAAFLAHPLIALPAAVTIWAYLCVAEGRRWLLALLLGLPILGLAQAGVAPFDGLLRRYDDIWFMAVGIVNSPAFVSEWTPRVLATALLDIGLILFATNGSREPLARFSRVACAVGPAMCLLAFFFADWLHNVLITQLQIWRAIWIGQLLMWLWVPSLVIEEWRRSPVGRLAAISVCCALASVEGDMSSYGWALALWALVWLAAGRRGLAIDRRVLRLVTVLTIAAGVIAIGQGLWNSLQMLHAHNRGTALTYPASLPFCIPVLTVPFIGGLLLMWQRPAWRRACALAAGAMLAAAIWQTDQRDAFTRFVESATPQQRPFQALIPPTATVYWEESQLAPVWILLHRAAYAQGGQFSGLLFNRETTMAARELSPFVTYVWARMQRCTATENWTFQRGFGSDCETPESDFVSFCTWPGPHPDFLVTSAAYTLAPLATWRFDPGGEQAPVDYRLYSCRLVQASVHAASAPRGAPR